MAPWNDVKEGKGADLKSGQFRSGWTILERDWGQKRLRILDPPIFDVGGV